MRSGVVKVTTEKNAASILWGVEDQTLGGWRGSDLGELRVVTEFEEFNMLC